MSGGARWQAALGAATGLLLLGLSGMLWRSGRFEVAGLVGLLGLARLAWWRWCQ